MNRLTIKTFAGFINLLVLLGLSLFLPAGTLDFWEAWIFLAVFFVPVSLITLYFLKNDPDLIERRLKAGPIAESRTSQKIIQSFANFFFILLFIVSGFDHRLHWSTVPTILVLAADFVVLLGLMLVFFVFKENSYTSAVVEIADRQEVISTGPYALVRHPMYSAGLLLFFSTPLALGSWWALPLAVPMIVLIILRLLDEEKLLRQSLTDYDVYCQKVRCRLIPYLW